MVNLVNPGTGRRVKGFIKQCFAVSALNIGQLSVGVGIGYSSILVPQLIASSNNESDGFSNVRIPVGVSETSWIVSLVSIGQIAGAILGAVLASLIGRKGAIMLSIMPSITGWCVLAISQNVIMLYAGRILTGIGMGMEGTVHPIYVCELASANYRGPLASSGVIVITAGVLLSYVLGTFISWKLCAWIFLSFHVLMALLIFVIPESPSWLIHKKLYSKADEALEWLSRDHEDFAMEIEHDLNNRMNKVLQHQTGSPQEDPSCWKKFTQFMSRIFCNQTLVPFFIIVTLFLIQNWSGFIVTIMYTVVIFEEAQMEINEFQATMIIGGVQVVGTTFGTIVLNIVGRRSLLLISTGFCSLFMGMLGTVFFLKQHEPESLILTSSGSWLPLACLVCFTLAFTIGLGLRLERLRYKLQIVGLINNFNECLLSYLIRTCSLGLGWSYCAGVSTCCCYAFIFLANFSYPYLILIIGNYGVFWIYTAVSALETKQRSLEEIENHFSECDGWMAMFTTIKPLPGVSDGNRDTSSEQARVATKILQR